MYEFCFDMFCMNLQQETGCGFEGFFNVLA